MLSRRHKLLTDLTIQYTRGNDGINGIPLVWVIDGECLYDIPVWPNYKDIFISSNTVINISQSYPDHDGITVRFIKDGSVVDELQTSEYFGSILLSNPTVLDLQDYAYGRYVISPYATFDGEQFTITNRDMSTLIPWAPTQPQYVDPDQV
jgi:uncharacterized protein YkvS